MLGSVQASGALRLLHVALGGRGKEEREHLQQQRRSSRSPLPPAHRPAAPPPRAGAGKASNTRPAPQAPDSNTRQMDAALKHLPPDRPVLMGIPLLVEASSSSQVGPPPSPSPSEEAPRKWMSRSSLSWSSRSKEDEEAAELELARRKLGELRNLPLRRKRPAWCLWVSPSPALVMPRPLPARCLLPLHAGLTSSAKKKGLFRWLSGRKHG